jgi:uncharacterized protein (TIGR02147 family)
MYVNTPVNKPAPSKGSPKGAPAGSDVHPAATVTVPASPDILDYTDYRRYLSDYYRARKAANRRYSLRALASEAGFPSHGHLKFLMEGARNLTQKTLMKLVPALGLDAVRTRYFEALVHFNQARTLSEKRVYFERLRESPAASGFRRMEASQLRAFRDWHLAPIREMIALKGFHGDPEWIGRRLSPRLEAREVKDALEELLAAGLIRRTANGFRQTDPDVTTDNEVKSFMVKSYHAEMLRLAARALDEVPAAERDVSAVCFAIRDADWPELKKRIQLLRKELKALEAKPGEGERIVQVNLQAFPLTRREA